MLRRLPIILACLAILALPAAAQDAPGQNDTGAGDTEIIVVRGERTGPALWRVYHPEHTGEVYVFVTVPWIPSAIDWNDRPVASVLEDARLVLTELNVSAGAVSASRIMAMMLRSLTINRSRLFMPRGTTLADRVGEELAGEYSLALAAAQERKAMRRTAERARRRSGEEFDELALLDDLPPEQLEARLAEIDTRRLHPFFQAAVLNGEAASSIGLSGSESIQSRIARLARRSRVPMRAVQSYTLAVSDISHLMREVRNFSAETNEICIREAVSFATAELPLIWMSAQAWARADVDALRARTASISDGRDCQLAMEQELGGLRTLGGQISAEIDYTGLWTGAIGTALQEGGTTLAVINARGWLSHDGVQARLLAEGYQVEGP